MGSTEGCGAEPPGTAGERLGKGLDWPQPAQPGSTRDPDFGKCAMRFSKGCLTGDLVLDPVVQHFGIGFEDLGGRSVLGGEELPSI